MHSCAFHVFALVLLAANSVGCDNKMKWYSSLQAVLKYCPLESWNNPGQEDFLLKFRRCMQERALAMMDSLLEDDVIPVFDGLDLVRFNQARPNSTDNCTESDSKNEENWTTIIVKRLLRVLRTHVFKVDVEHLTSNNASSVNNSKTEADNNIFEGRMRRHRRRHRHMMSFMMMGFLLMGSILVPMGFQFLAVLGGKALLLAKMALILSSIQGLKKIATNGVNYGLYHSPVGGGWHDRSHIEQQPQIDLPFPPHMRP